MAPGQRHHGFGVGIIAAGGMKVSMLHAVFPRAIHSQIFETSPLQPVESPWVPCVRRHLVGILAGDPKAKQELESLLKEHELTLDVITATAFEMTIKSQLHVAQMVQAAYSRRNAGYKELERLRAMAIHDAQAEAPSISPAKGGPLADAFAGA